MEAEIEGLRDELEKTRAEHVEEATLGEGEGEKSVGLDSQLAMMYKKFGRKAKVRELKAKTRPWDSDQGSEILEGYEPKDFPPSNLTPGLTFTAKWVTRNPSSPSLSLETPLEPSPLDEGPSPNQAQVDSPQIRSHPLPHLQSARSLTQAQARANKHSSPSFCSRSVSSKKRTHNSLRTTPKERKYTKAVRVYKR